MNASIICRILEIARWVGVVAGFQAAFLWRDGNTGLKNLLRPIMTALLIVFVLPLMISAVTFSG